MIVERYKWPKIGCIEIYTDEDVYPSGKPRKQWRWRLKSSNGRIIAASTEGYSSKENCLKNIAAICDLSNFVMGATSCPEGTGQFDDFSQELQKHFWSHISLKEGRYGKYLPKAAAPAHGKAKG